MADPAATALLAATTLHLGFQLTVTVLVYPALSRVPTDAWPPAHDAHSRAIVPLVVATYGALLATGTWALLTTPMTPGLLLALLGTTVTFATTAFAAAPTHARLSRDGRTVEAIHRLLLADKVRTGGALLATMGALLNLAT